MIGRSIFEHFNDLSHLAFPHNCFGCNRALDEGEQSICDDCVQHFPKTLYWHHDDNTVEKLFWGKIPIVRACSYLFFSKGGVVQELMHQLKYKGKTEVGELLGAHFGRELLGTYYGEVDAIIPVPLHQSKQKKRGYNQCEPIAQALGAVLGKPVWPSAVERLQANESQTRKGRYERWINVKELFAVSEPEKLEHKHILMIDDVVTTGSTLEACAGAVLQVPKTRVSIATVACPSPV